ncbi:MAG: hypothetical protein ACOCXP_01605 [Candidatus Dojkabacteria bacterium]
MSNYFLYSYLDDSAKSYYRDFFQSLRSFKRSVTFKNASELGFNYKYLGKNLSEDTVLALEKVYADFISSLHISCFTHQVRKINYEGSLISAKLKETPELHEYFRMVNDQLQKLDDDNLILPKDPNRRLGAIKLAEITSNISRQDKKKLLEHIQNYEELGQIEVCNLSLIKTDLVKHKRVQAKLWEIRLMR